MGRFLLGVLVRDKVCTAAFLFAVASFFVAPLADVHTYAASIDVRVLVCLFLLMASVEGMRSEGVLAVAAIRVSSRAHSLRMLALVLVGLVFFTSMLVTNDVALLTFVPFSLMTLRLADQTALAGPVIVLETLAANLGSALTPVGNPQNLYLYTRFDLSPAAFFDAVLPLALPSAALLFAGVMLLGSHPVRPAVRMSETTPARPRLAVFAAVFLIALLTVFDLLPAWGALAAGMAPLLLFARTEVRRVDYTLLLTFVFFFLFIGNLVRIEEVHNFMRPLLAGPREVLLSGAGLSQVLSNVPAAILLSGFTGDARSLLRGVNIGGCGTIVASLASLISYKLFIREHPASGMRYLALHTLVNLPFLLLLTGVALLLAR